MIRRSTAVAAAGAAVALAALATGGAARAAMSRGPTLEVTVIQATPGDAGRTIDPRLPELVPHMQEQPFVRFDVYQLLGRSSFPLDRPAQLALPNGRTLQVTVSVTVVDGGEKRYQIGAEIGAARDAGKAAFLKSLQVTASANEPFFIGGQSYQGGTLFIELNVRP